VVAQKALSTVYRTGQRYGVSYLVDILHGKADERSIRACHDKLSVFGIGKDTDAAQWRSLFRQLVARGYLTGDEEGHGTLQLTDRARLLLRGEETFLMRVARAGERNGKAKRERKSPAAAAVPAEHQAAFAALKALRARLAAEAKLPPYVICHDRTLVELAEKRPQSLTALGDITGLGASKIKRYGQAMLDTLSAFAGHPLLKNRLSTTVNETLALHLQGLEPEAIASRRGLGIGTIYGHFAEAIEAGVIEARAVLSDLDDGDLDEIHAAFERLGTLESGKIGPVHSALDGRFDYGLLKCVLAELA
jgi:ATP-dependent DNA helicase RecQ